MNNHQETNIHSDICCCFCLFTTLCLTLYNPMEYSPPGSSVHKISQARILEWVVISFSRGSSPTQGWNPHVLPWRAGSFTPDPPGKPEHHDCISFYNEQKHIMMLTCLPSWSSLGTKARVRANPCFSLCGIVRSFSGLRAFLSCRPSLR